MKRTYAWTAALLLVATMIAPTVAAEPNDPVDDLVDDGGWGEDCEGPADRTCYDESQGRHCNLYVAKQCYYFGP